MVSGDLHAVTVRLGVLRDIMIELAVALPPDRTAGVVMAIGNRLTERVNPKLAASARRTGCRRRADANAKYAASGLSLRSAVRHPPRSVN